MPLAASVTPLWPTMTRVSITNLQGQRFDIVLHLLLHAPFPVRLSMLSSPSLMKSYRCFSFIRTPCPDSMMCLRVCQECGALQHVLGCTSNELLYKCLFIALKNVFSLFQEFDEKSSK